MIDEAAGDKKEIRQAIDIFQRRGADGLARLRRKLDHQAFGAPRDGARHVQRRRRRRAAGQHERPQRLQLRVHLVDLLLEALHLRVRHPQRLVFELLAAIGHAQIGAEIE